MEPRKHVNKRDCARPGYTYCKESKKRNTSIRAVAGGGGDISARLERPLHALVVRSSYCLY